MNREYGPPNPRLASVIRAKTNADLIAAIGPLYLRPGDTVLDLTYGNGIWWKKWRQPDEAFTGDYTTRTPYHDGQFDIVTYDPAYVVTGNIARSTLNGHHERYGLDKAPVEVLALLDDMTAGLREAARIASTLVLQKCQQQVDWHSFVDFPRHIKNIGERDLGLVLIDEIIHERGFTPQPMWGPNGALRRWRRAARTHSHLLVWDASARRARQEVLL